MVLCIKINELNWILELMTCRVQKETLLNLQRRKRCIEEKDFRRKYSKWFFRLYAKVEQCCKLRAIRNLNGT